MAACYLRSMIRSQFMVLLAVLMTAFVPHDFHVSITTLKHDVVKDELQITIKLTTHDVEYALENTLGGIAHFGSDQESEAARAALKTYILQNLILVSETETLDIEYLGKEVEYEDMYCYLQVTGFDKFKSLEVKNSLLFDNSGAQSNVVHLENARGVQTHTCTISKPVVRFTP